MKVMNISEQPRTFIISVTGLEGIALVSNHRVETNAAENHDVILNVRVPPEIAPKGSHKIYFRIVAEDDPEVAIREKTTFMMP
jgi:hypothetical protein